MFERYGCLRALAVTLGLGLLLAAGCAQPGSCPAFIPEAHLPAGWAPLPTSELPPIDKTPWWTQNPQVLEGDGLAALDLSGRPTTASRLLAAIYAKADDRVVLFCLDYASAQLASDEYQALVSEGASSDRFIGLLKAREHAIVIMHISHACADRDFFAAHFDSVVSEATEPLFLRAPAR